MLKHADDFLFEVRRIVEKENKKNVVMKTMQEHYGINNVLSLTEQLLSGDVSILAKIPTSFLVEMAKNLGVNVDLYFEKDEDLGIGEMHRRISFMEQRILRLEKEIERLSGKVGE